MSDTNRVSTAIVKEVTAGTTPSNPAYQILRTTGQPGLKQTPETVTSNEIRDDGQIVDLPRVGKNTGGDVGFELSFAALDTILEGALRSTWINKPTIVNATEDTEIDDVDDATDTYGVASGGAAFVASMLVLMSGFTASANNGIFEVDSSTGTSVVVADTPSLTDEATVPLGARIRAVGFIGADSDITATTTGGNALLSSSLDFTTLGLVVGEYLKVGGSATGDKFATAALNRRVRIAGISANRLDLENVPGWVTDSGTSKTIKIWWGDYLRNATTLNAYTIERQFKDHDPVTYEEFKGMSINTLTIDAPGKSILTATAGFVGLDATMLNARTSGATDIAAPTNDILNTSSNLGTILEGGEEVGAPNYVLGTTVSINNSLQPQDAKGSEGPVGFGMGEFECKLTLNTYFGDKEIAQKVINNTETSLMESYRDAAGHELLFDWPRMKFEDGGADVSGKNDFTRLDAPAQVLMHKTLLYMMHVQRSHYVEI